MFNNLINVMKWASLFLILVLVSIASASEGEDAQYLQMRRTACLVLSRVHSNSQKEVIDEARDAGALAYLVKPYEKSELLPAIEQAISRFREAHT